MSRKQIKGSLSQREGAEVEGADERKSCSHCGNIVSPSWTSDCHKGLLCSGCALYVKKTGGFPPLDSLENRKSTRVKDVQGQGDVRRAPERDAKRQSRKHANVFADSIFVTSRGRKRSKPLRTQKIETVNLPIGLKGEIGKVAELKPGLENSKAKKYCIHRGVTIFQDDFVALQSIGDNIVFVIVRDFFLDPNGTALFSFAWLIPRSVPPENDTIIIIPPFDVGPEHDSKEPVDRIQFVLCSTAHLFSSNTKLIPVT